MLVEKIDMNLIDVDSDFNCRENIVPQSCFDLATSIAEKGLLQPVVVCPLDQILLRRQGKRIS